LLSHSIPRKHRTALAGCVASVLAALAIAAPSGAVAAVDQFRAGASVPDAPDRMTVPDAPDRTNIPDNVLPAVPDTAIDFTRPGG
jgi:hypothetical protein